MTTPIKHILDSFLVGQDSWKTQLLGNWESIIGNLKDKVHIEQILDDTVILGVYNSSWMQELYLLSNVLLKLINQKLDQPRIKHLRFKKSSKRVFVHRTTTMHAKNKKLVTLTQKEQHALTNIDDPDLRTALKEFLVRCYQESS